MDQSSPPAPGPTPSEAAIFAIERPHTHLLTYYTLCCLPLLLFPPAAVLVWVVNYFRYHTMRYQFTKEGVSMRWGILFRKEVLLNYARIQDIHLVSNIVERWLGLARIQVQTASGTAGAEMTIEGLLEFEAVRDFLYAHMRGTRETPHSVPAIPSAAAAGTGDLAEVLQQVAAELRQIRHLLEERKP